MKLATHHLGSGPFFGRVLASTLLVGAFLMGDLLGQVRQPSTSPGNQGGYQGGYPGGYPQAPNEATQRGMIPGGSTEHSQDGFPGLRTVYPQAHGFPIFNPATKSYSATGRTQSLTELMGAMSRPSNAVPLPRTEQAADAWPTWVKLPSQQVTLKRSASRAILIRVCERIWLTEPGEAAPVPLWFWDKFRVAQKDAVVEARHMGGEFELSMHDGARLRARGITRLVVVQLDEEIAELALDDVRELWWTGRTRLLKLALPNGATIEAPQCQFRISSDGDVATVTNFGPAPLRYRYSLGQTELAHGQRLRFFTSPKTGEYVPMVLTLEGSLEPQQRGRTFEVRARGEDGRVSWGGARIPLPAGARLVLDPLSGREFLDNKTRPK